jgi:hypothetical protein
VKLVAWHLVGVLAVVVVAEWISLLFGGEAIDE